MKIIGRLLGEEEFEKIVKTEIWQNVSHHGLGSKLRTELFNKRRTTKDRKKRKMISNILEGHYLG